METEEGGEPESLPAVDAPIVAEPPPRRGSRMWLVALLGAVSIIAIVVALLAVGLWRGAEDASRREKERRRVAEIAGQFGESLLSYDYTRLSQARARLLRNATRRFAREYTGALSGGLEAAITGLQATSTASVRDVYVTEIVGNAARAVVTLDSEVRSSAATRRTVNSYLDMALVKQNGRWKVDSVISVAALDEQTRANPPPVEPPTEPPPTSEPPP